MIELSIDWSLGVWITLWLLFFLFGLTFAAFVLGRAIGHSVVDFIKELYRQ